MTRCSRCAAPAEVLFDASDFNRRTSTAHFRYYRCRDCLLVFMEPVPMNLGDCYPSGYHDVPVSLEALAGVAALREPGKLDLIRRYAPGCRLIEVGSSFGAFAYLAREAGFDVRVIEMDPRCCRFLEGTLGLSTVQTDDPAACLANLAPADVIVLWQVVEHLADPWRVLRAAVTRVTPGGIVVVSTPNPECPQFRLTGRFWFHLDAPRHLLLIPPRLLCDFMQEQGAKPVLVTSLDAESARHNRSSWQWSFMNMGRGAVSRRGLWAVGFLMRTIMGAREKAELGGPVYTAVFRVD